MGRLTFLVLISGWLGAQESAPGPPPAEAPPGMVLVPAGKYRVGMERNEIEALVTRLQLDAQTAMLFEASEPSQVITLDDFYIDVDEVTNKAWAAFLRDTGRTPSKRWRGDEELPDLPVTNVTIDDAEAFLTWCGKRLPSEFEWEAAARYRRPEDRKARWWSWGDDPDVGELRCNDASAARSALTPALQLAPVGSFPRGKSELGINDLAGNAAEMTSSNFVPYPGSHSTRRSFSGSLLVMRGGSAFATRVQTATTVRLPLTLTSSALVGFRGARSVNFIGDLKEEFCRSFANVSHPTIDGFLGVPELAREPSRRAALVSGGWAPVPRVPSRARFLGAACRATPAFCDSSEIATVMGMSKGPVMLGCFVSTVDFVKPRIPAGKYWLMCELDRQGRLPLESSAFLQSWANCEEGHEVLLRATRTRLPIATTLEVTEAGRTLSVVLRFPCVAEQPALQLAFQLEAAEGALAAFR